MADTFRKLKAGIADLFPETEGMTIGTDTPLGDIPDFDSMAAVNLQNFISETFNVTIPLDLFGAEVTLGEIVILIENPGRIDTAAK
ncbi:MAG TPA: acyl carrier protein [Syntrophales bacterium]|jgi:acyl carrier protein|nr:acyl carrier protein [Syntrophales bacterium]HON22531.1 acyl carrier protein [Syntrophales bacterium]HOU76776.1 acyl carrier protein [Syntrophales bacterium]HPC31899.1 acyl carrier protein [Syntrophales bacterium]HQG33561.1 acyl carrier protein [Syntrophales bacterium]